MNVVVDTNVVVSRFLSSKGTPAHIFEHWQAGTFELLVSEDILTEYERVLNYPDLRARHHLSAAEIADIISDFRKFAVHIAVEETPQVIKKDPDDDKFLVCAAAGGAAYIVSGDPHLLALKEYQEIPILPPAAFLSLLSS